MTMLLRAQPVPRLPDLSAGMELSVADWDGNVTVSVSSWQAPDGGEQWVRGIAGGRFVVVRLFERAP